MSSKINREDVFQACGIVNGLYRIRTLVQQHTGVPKPKKYENVLKLVASVCGLVYGLSELRKHFPSKKKEQ